MENYELWRMKDEARPHEASNGQRRTLNLELGGGGMKKAEAEYLAKTGTCPVTASTQTAFIICYHLCVNRQSAAGGGAMNSSLKPAGQ